MPANPERKWIEIDVADGKMDVYVVVPGTTPAPGIVLLQEIFGVNEAIRAEADRLAEAGFVVAAPDLFWRAGRRISLGYSPDEVKQAFGLMSGFDRARGAEDAARAAKALAAADRATGEVSFVGFCLGGKLAVMAGARYPAHAVVSFYGVQLDQNLHDIDRITAPLQIHVGDQDSHVPAATIETLKAHTSGRPNVDIFVYPGAQHAFFNTVRRDVFLPEAAASARERMLAVLRGPGIAA